MAKITFTQTFGMTIEIPDDKVEAFKRSVSDNNVEQEFENCLPSVEVVHYEGSVEEVKS
jgi:hypothetical protein